MRTFAPKRRDMTTIVINDNTQQAKQFIKHARTLPFTTVEEEKAKTLSAWDQAIAEGAVSVDEFIDELKARIAKWPDDDA